MRLILCVDRDNDFGEKAGVSTPVVGRRNNYSAAEKLIMADPEDSDANTLFAAIKEYDTLKADGEKVSIATVCGSVNVGRESDEKIKNELEAVLKRLKPDSVILFDDGAEDEAVAPIIESRVIIDRKVRVVVQQSERFESFYYMAKKILMEEKARKRVMIPLAIACILWSTAAFLGRPEMGTGAIVFLIGVTLFIWAFRLENLVFNLGRDAKEAVRTGAISVYIYMFSLFFISLGFLFGYTNSIDSENLEHLIIQFFQASIWFFIGGIWLVVFGKVLDDYLRLDQKDYSIWPVSFSLISAGFLLTGTLGLVEYILGYSTSNSVIGIFWSIVTAMVVAFIGIVGHGYLKEHIIPQTRVDDWRF
jgi:putative membrane protein